ncbi:MAG TPA: 50S ribosomal protein L15 [Gemmataceae bacterium]|jgi:large subunit ribosomal protein L15
MDLSTVHQGVHTRKPKKRVGRGIGSGHGKTATRGSKGQYASAGAEMFKALFEGGQTPLYRRSPKRGFSHRTWDVPAHVINVGAIDAAFDAGAEVTLEALKASGVLKGTQTQLRVLGNGDVGKKLVVHAHHFSASAKEKIEKAGGQAVVVPGPKKPVRNKMKPRPAKAE